MTLKKPEPEEICMSTEEASKQLKTGMDAADYVLSELKLLEDQGFRNPELYAKAEALKKKLKAVKRKWDL